MATECIFYYMYDVYADIYLYYIDMILLPEEPNMQTWMSKCLYRMIYCLYLDHAFIHYWICHIVHRPQASRIILNWICSVLIIQHQYQHRLEVPDALNSVDSRLKFCTQREKCAHTLFSSDLQSSAYASFCFINLNYCEAGCTCMSHVSYPSQT